MNELIYRQEAIDTLDIGAELLRRVLDDTDVVGIEREKYEWGLDLIESYIADTKELPPAQTEIIRCNECKFYSSIQKHSMNLKIGICSLSSRYIGDDGFCSEAERREDDKSRVRQSP